MEVPGGGDWRYRSDATIPGRQFLPKDALPEAKEDASDIAWSVLGDLVDAARGSMTVLDIVMELHDEIDTNRKYAETYPQEREKLEQLEGFMLSLLDHLDEIEVRTGMPSNYRVELNVEDSELMGWDYVDETVLALLKDSPVEEVRYALERAERRADYRGENVSGKDVYQELFDAFGMEKMARNRRRRRPPACLCCPAILRESSMLTAIPAIRQRRSRRIIT